MGTATHQPVTMNKPIRQVWTFSSDSNPSLEYQTLQYSDGSTSCNCKGWTRRTASDGSRSCKHTRWVDMGMADRHCTGSRDYVTSVGSVQQKVNDRSVTPKLRERKFAL